MVCKRKIFIVYLDLLTSSQIGGNYFLPLVIVLVFSTYLTKIVWSRSDEDQ